MDLSDATVAQVLIPVEDFERGISFYRDVLGIPFLFSAPPQMAFFMCGTVRLLVGVMPPGLGFPQQCEVWVPREIDGTGTAAPGEVITS